MGLTVGMDTITRGLDVKVMMEVAATGAALSTNPSCRLELTVAEQNGEQDRRVETDAGEGKVGTDCGRVGWKIMVGGWKLTLRNEGWELMVVVRIGSDGARAGRRIMAGMVVGDVKE